MMIFRPGQRLVLPGLQVSSAGGTGGGGFVGVLDSISNVAAAYSLRKLRSAYAGSAVRIRRSSDSTEQDVGFDGSGDFDTSAFSAFVSGGTGYVKTWYDQSGNSKNLSQTTTSLQPTLVVSPNVHILSSGVQVMSALDVLGVASLTNATILACTLCATNDALDRYGFGSYLADTSTAKKHINPSADASIRFDGAFIAGLLSHPTIRFIRSTIKNSTAYYDRFNGDTNINGDTVTDGGIVDDFYIGKLITSGEGSKQHSEYIITSTAIGTTDHNTIGNDMATYYSLSWTTVT